MQFKTIERYGKENHNVELVLGRVGVGKTTYLMNQMLNQSESTDKNEEGVSDFQLFITSENTIEEAYERNRMICEKRCLSQKRNIFLISIKTKLVSFEQIEEIIEGFEKGNIQTVYIDSSLINIEDSSLILTDKFNELSEYAEEHGIKLVLGGQLPRVKNSKREDLIKMLTYCVGKVTILEDTKWIY